MHTTNQLLMADDRALYRGTLPATGRHRHAAPVLLLGLSGRFRLDLGAGRVEHCRAAVVAAGVEHVFDPAGESVALVYLEPDAPEALALRATLAAERGVLFDPAPAVRDRSATEARLGSFDVGALWRLPSRGMQDASALEPRIAQAMRRLRQPDGGPWLRDTLAAEAGLSGSRFNHLFSEQAGVSFRSYRLWAQVRAAMAGLGPRVHLTDAAMRGGFADSAHFSRSFRQTFGMTPSSVLGPLRARPAMRAVRA